MEEKKSELKNQKRNLLHFNFLSDFTYERKFCSVATYPLFFAFALLLLSGCTTTQEFVSPSTSANAPLYLANAKATCQPGNEFKKWSAFYGILPFSKLEPKTLFPKENTAYRIKETYSWADGTISLLLGISVSITRKTWIVEDCGKTKDSSPLKQASVEDSTTTDSPDFQKAVQSAVESYLKQKEQEYEEVLDATISKNKKELQLSDRLATIWLKSGELLQGEILFQNEDTIVFKTPKGTTETFSKSKVVRVKIP